MDDTGLMATGMAARKLTEPDPDREELIEQCFTDQAPRIPAVANGSIEFLVHEELEHDAVLANQIDKAVDARLLAVD